MPVMTTAEKATYDYLAQYTYDYVKVGETAGAPISVVDDTYETIAELITPSRPAGTYEMLVSMVWTYSTAARSAFYRWSSDGGATWKELSTETKDKTNTENFSYSFPKSLASGITHLILQARKEGANDEMIVQHANLVVERKA